LIGLPLILTLADIVLKLHAMQFKKILSNGIRVEVLQYAKTHLSPFATRHIADIQKLMACLLWTGKFDKSYNSLLSQISWMRNLKDSSAIFWDNYTTVH